MWSIKSIINKILGRTETEEPAAEKNIPEKSIPEKAIKVEPKTSTPSISPQKTKAIIEPKEQAKVLEPSVTPEKSKDIPKEKVQEQKTIKAPHP